MKYLLLNNYLSTGLAAEVQEYLDQGWVVHGSPFQSPSGQIYQAIVLKVGMFIPE